MHSPSRLVPFFTVLTTALATLGTACVPDDPPDSVAEIHQTAWGPEDGRSSPLVIPLVLVLWEGPNFTGYKRQFVMDEASLGAGWSNGSDCLRGANFDDQASSVGVHPGPDYETWKIAHGGEEPTVSLWEHRQFAGNHIVLRAGSYPDLGTLGMNDMVSSIRFRDNITFDFPVQAPAFGAATIAQIGTVLKFHTASLQQLAAGYCAAADSVMQLVESSPDLAGQFGGGFSSDASWVEMLMGPNYDALKPISLYANTGYNPGSIVDSWAFVRDLDLPNEGSGALNDTVRSVKIAHRTSLSRGAAASQSTTALGAVASRAVDGNPDGSFGNGSVTHTGLEFQPWWQVDLGDIGWIDSVKISNRTDCCASRLANYYVLVSDTPFSTDLTTALAQSTKLVYRAYQAGPSGAITRLNIGRTGRFVRVQLAGTDYLHLAEVDVQGLRNLARGRSTTQISTFAGGLSSRAVDGNTDGNWIDNSVTHTDAALGAFWQVDLGSIGNYVERVVVFNRSDCCYDRLTGFKVYSSNWSLARDAGGHSVPDNFTTMASYGVPITTPDPIPVVILHNGGRFVRIELDNSNYLSLAEVMVFGS